MQVKFEVRGGRPHLQIKVQCQHCSLATLTSVQTTSENLTVHTLDNPVLKVWK